MNKHSPSQSDDDDRTTAVGLIRFAYEYIDAAIIVGAKHRRRNGFAQIASVPAYFLAMHGIELTLKAFLRFKGISTKALRGSELGHDICACYSSALGFGLHDIYSAAPDDPSAMAQLSQLNDYQGLRYIKTGAKVFPQWSIVEPLAVRLHQGVAPLVGFKTFSESVDDQK